MRDVPSSDSDQGSEANGTYDGLSRASIYIGEGPFLYLQIIKTFFNLFLFLTIINIPVYMLYLTTSENDFVSYMNPTILFENFQLGNIGKLKKSCDFSWINYETAIE
jgi:hypothetical protein